MRIDYEYALGLFKRLIINEDKYSLDENRIQEIYDYAINSAKCN